MKQNHFFQTSLSALGLAAVICGTGWFTGTYFGSAWERIVIVFLIHLIVVLGLGIFIGNSGILSFGHLSFMGIGAYLSGILTIPTLMKKVTLPHLPEWLIYTELNIYLSILVVILFVIVIAFLIGIPICRLDGSSAVIATLALLVIIHGVFIGARDYTRGSQSFFGVPLETNLNLVVAIAIITILAARFYRDSSFGLQLRASRDNEVASRAMGINVITQRLIAWTLSAVFIGVAGVLYGHFLGAFSPKSFYFSDTLALLAMLIVGGMSTVTGAIFGTVVITFVTEILRNLEAGPQIFNIDLPYIYGTTTIGIGLMILFTMYFKREGFFGTFEWERYCFRNHPPPAGSARSYMKDTRGDNKRIIVAKDISKVFDGLTALDSVNLELEQGKIYGLIGPNGSGKTTFVNVLTGVLPVTDGIFELDGRDITREKSNRIAKMGIARSFQNIRLFFNLTVLENVEVAMLSNSPELSRPKIQESSFEILNELGLIEYAFSLATTLPYGSQRKVEVARALALSPSFLVLDEPAAGMNEGETNEFKNLLGKLLKKYGFGIVIIDHDLSLIMDICEIVFVLNEGYLIAKGEPEYVQNHPAVVEAYLGSKSVMPEETKNI